MIYFGVALLLLALYNNFIVVSLVIAAIFITLHWLKKINFWEKNKKCSWCDLKDNMTFIDGWAGDSYWEHGNLDGSRDKRVKENISRTQYISQYKCNYCNAVTEFIHEADEYPNQENFVCSRKLLEKGDSGDNRWGDTRIGEDWEE